MALMQSTCSLPLARATSGEWSLPLPALRLWNVSALEASLLLWDYKLLEEFLRLLLLSLFYYVWDISALEASLYVQTCHQRQMVHLYI